MFSLKKHSIAGLINLKRIISIDKEVTSLATTGWLSAIVGQTLEHEVGTLPPGQIHSPG